ADLFSRTGALDALSQRAAILVNGSPRRAVPVFVVLILLVGTVNNNLTTSFAVLPAVIVTMRVMTISARTTHRLGSLFLPSGNAAGAATPTGDFPALSLISSGVIRYDEYLQVGTPLFLVTAAVLVILYMLLTEKPTDDDDARLALTLLAIATRNDRINRKAL